MSNVLDLSSWAWRFRVDGIEKVTDGDTFWLRLDVGFRQSQLTELRLAEFDTPELYRPQSDFERDEARRARSFVIEWLEWHITQPDVITVAFTEKDPDSFGRWLATIRAFGLDGYERSLGEELRADGLASIWPTRWRDEFDTEDPA